HTFPTRRSSDLNRQCTCIYVEKLIRYCKSNIEEESILNIGIIGAGAIATYVLGEVQKEKDLSVTSIFVRNDEKYQHLEDDHVTLYTDFEKFIASEIDIVVEAAGVEAAKEWLPRLVSEKDTIVISIGALANEQFIEQLQDTLKTSNKNLYLPSGAIAGLDFIQNIKAAGLLNE